MKFSFPNFSKFRFTNWTSLCWSHDDNCPDWFFTLARTANRVQVATYLPPCPHTCLQFYFENKRFFVSLLSSIAFYSAILCQVLRTFVYCSPIYVLENVRRILFFKKVFRIYSLNLVQKPVTEMRTDCITRYRICKSIRIPEYSLGLRFCFMMAK